MCIVSMPAIKARAHRKFLNPSIGRTTRLTARWSCSMRLLRYFDCRVSRSAPESARMPSIAAVFAPLLSMVIFSGALELKRHLDVSYPTAWLVKHKLMEVMVLREEGRQLTGRIEADDAYLGGERPGGMPGRGSENKVAFVAAVQTTESGQAIFMCLSRRPFTKKSIQEFAETSLAAPATLVTDGLGCFTAVRGLGILHEQHITGGGAASAKHPSFQAVNTALGNLKTALSGTYHAFGFEKYGHRYLGQVQYLFNRRFDLRSILERLGRAACQGKPCPLYTVRAAELPC